MKQTACFRKFAIDADMLGVLQGAALEAGRVIMHHYVNGCAVERKQDASPVTQADRDAEAVILKALSSVAGDVPIVAEEEASAGRLPQDLGRRFFLVDPLDGTREFLLRNGDFTVNIALIEDGMPVFGLVYAPVSHSLFIGHGGKAQELRTSSDHQIVSATDIRVRSAPEKRVAVCSRSHVTEATKDYLHAHALDDYVSVGSSVKFCMIARGEADIYPRFGPTMEWDTAAGDAVLRAAGGMTINLDGSPLSYGFGKTAGIMRFSNPDFVAYGAGFAPFSLI